MVEGARRATETAVDLLSCNTSPGLHVKRTRLFRLRRRKEPSTAGSRSGEVMFLKLPGYVGRRVFVFKDNDLSTRDAIRKRTVERILNAGLFETFGFPVTIGFLIGDERRIQYRSERVRQAF